MENTPGKLHPLMMVAAISVTAASLAAVGIMTGIVPGKKAEAPAPAVMPVVAQSAAPAVVPAATEPAAKPAKPAPVKKVVKEEGARREPAPAGTPVPPAPPVSAAVVPAAAPPVPPAPVVCRDCGTVESVREVTRKGEGSGIGAVAGGVLGGVLGHQVGSGRGKDLATVAGAVGGAVAGHQVEKYQRRTTRYEITVRMDDGTTQTVTAESQPSWRGGDRVKVTNGTIAPLM